MYIRMKKMLGFQNFFKSLAYNPLFHPLFFFCLSFVVRLSIRAVELKDKNTRPKAVYSALLIGPKLALIGLSVTTTVSAISALVGKFDLSGTVFMVLIFTVLYLGASLIQYLGCDLENPSCYILVKAGYMGLYIPILIGCFSIWLAISLIKV